LYSAHTHIAVVLAPSFGNPSSRIVKDCILSHSSTFSAAAILRDLDIKRVRLLSNNPRKVKALSENGVEVIASCEAAPNPHSFAYLRNQERKNGPCIELVLTALQRWHEIVSGRVAIGNAVIRRNAVGTISELEA
jgi:hypothetical protein